MSEPAPQPNPSTFLVVLLLLCVAALVYLDWRRAGEIDNLHARIDRLPQAAPRPLQRDEAPAPAPPPPPRVNPQAGTPEPPTPAPERAADEGDVIRDPVLGETGPNGMPAQVDVHPLLRSVLEAHGEKT